MNNFVKFESRIYTLKEKYLLYKSITSLLKDKSVKSMFKVRAFDFRWPSPEAYQSLQEHVYFLTMNIERRISFDF